MTTIISCVVDNEPRFLMQAWNWMLSLAEAGVVPDAETRILVHHVDALTGAPELDLLQSLGAELVPVAPFGPGPAAWSNKLRQMETPAIRAASRVILSDTDLLFVTDPRKHFDAANADVLACIVTVDNPPEAKLQALWDAAGLPLALDSSPDMKPQARTTRFNCNGGLLLLRAPAIAALAESWPRWSRWCLGHGAILGDWLLHADQLGLALAMQEAGVAPGRLDLSANFHTHLGAPALQQVSPRQIHAFHYHNGVDADGLPAAVGVDWIDRQIGEANAKLRGRRRPQFHNGLFWEHRYRSNPALGSGLGSRGAVLARKQALLTPVLRQFAVAPVVDIGCGDIETLRPAQLKNLTGYDLSAQAVKLAREKRPDWTFVEGGADAVPPGVAALALCLDVAIHQPTREDYRALVAHVANAATDTVLMSGYESPPEGQGIVFFHEPLSQTLAAQPGVIRVTRLGRWRDVTLLAAIKTPVAGRNPHDIRADWLAWGLTACPTPALLADLVGIGRKHLGFFPQTIIRTLEYPWLAARLSAAGGLRILEVGAGVSPLPLFLARIGAEVTTVDPHPTRRDPAARQDWNEWGFLDYAALDPRIRSLQEPVESLAGEAPFDVITSVSVIEHMPAAIRRAALKAMAGMLQPGGRMLLTLDLVPGSDALWRMSEGQEVEAAEVHGSVADVLAELSALSLTCDEVTLRRAIPGSRTDLLMIDARAGD